jgi:kynurenine formamidase
MRTPPSQEEVKGYLKSLSNWGRWGPDDLLGTLNFIAEADVARAAGLVRSGKVVSCSQKITYASGRAGWAEDGHLVSGSTPYPVHYMLASIDNANPREGSRSAALDGYMIAPHGQLITHLDTPCHTFIDGVLFNGIPADRVNHEKGAEIGGMDLVPTGITARGVLLDIPASQDREFLEDGEAIYPEDLEAAEQRFGVKVGRGDILLVRTGYHHPNRKGAPPGMGNPRPGLQVACAPWLYEREVAVLGADMANDVQPSGYEDQELLRVPLHAVAMWATGLWLIDNCYLEDLSRQCAAEGRYEFLLVLAPLRLTHGTGSPMNPLAFF